MKGTDYACEALLFLYVIHSVPGILWLQLRITGMYA